MEHAGTIDRLANVGTLPVIPTSPVLNKPSVISVNHDYVSVCVWGGGGGGGQKRKTERSNNNNKYISIGTVGYFH